MTKYTNDEMIAVLKKALRKLKSGKTWCTGALARTADKVACRYSSSDAESWDLFGAVLVVAEDQYLASAVVGALEQNIHQFRPSLDTLADFNDARNTTWKDITGLVNTTIKHFGADSPTRKAAHRGE